MCFTSIISFQLGSNLETGTINASILHWRKARHGEVKWLVPGHTAKNWRGHLWPRACGGSECRFFQGILLWKERVVSWGKDRAWRHRGTDFWAEGKQLWRWKGPHLWTVRSRASEFPAMNKQESWDSKKNSVATQLSNKIGLNVRISEACLSSFEHPWLVYHQVSSYLFLIFSHKKSRQHGIVKRIQV